MRVATNIKWDTDGEPHELPGIVDLPDDLEEDAVADWLSDRFGFCVFSLTVEETP